MKVSRIILILGLVTALAISSVSLALAQFKFSYTSGFQVQNLETSDASVVITYYNQDGSTAFTANDTIPASGSKTYFPLPSGLGGSFNGSVVVSSDKKTGAVVNVLSTDFKASASYVGADQGSTTVQLPLLMKGNAGFDTWFNVQNVSTSAASVSVSYSDGTSASATIQPGAAATFNQATETHNQSVFSAIITSDQPIVAAAVQESSTVLFAYSGFTGGSTNPVMPLINANNAGYITGVQIQNAGTTATDVTVSYTPSVAGSACTETQTIQPGASATFALFAFASGANSTCAGGAKFVGSAQVTGNSANQPLAAIVNQLSGTNGEAYSAFDPATASASIVMPLIMDRNSGFFTGFNVVNIGSSNTTVTCDFSNFGTNADLTFSLNAGATATQIQDGQIADGYVGSAVCSGSGGAQLLAVVNELLSSANDNFLVYEGINN